MILDLTPEQLNAVTLASNPTRPVISITGPAGAGKSTVLAAAAHRNPTAAVLAPTNKAATVLRNKGITRAITVHAALYTPTEISRHRKTAEGVTVYQKDEAGNDLLDSRGQPIPEITHTDLAFDLRSEGLEALPPTAFVDESSMLSETVLADLHATFRNVVLIGDKFQLPPVKSKDVFALHPPALELQEVHRTALESPILRWANEMRLARAITPPQLDEHALRVCKFNNTKLWQSIVANECQAVCFSNRLRHIINANIRAERGLPRYSLAAGEQIVSLDNIRLTIDGRPMLKFYNGEILTLAETAPSAQDASSFYHPVTLKFTEGRSHRMWPFWLKGFWEEYSTPSWNNRIYRMRQRGELYGAPLLADNAYALTAHKAQGSEWNNVAVFHQQESLSRVLGGLMATRWLYTAVTRARQRLLMVEC